MLRGRDERKEPDEEPGGNSRGTEQREKEKRERERKETSRQKKGIRRSEGVCMHVSKGKKKGT